MFSSIKLWIAGIGTALVATLYTLLRIKSTKLDVAEEVIQHQEEELDLLQTEKEVSEHIRREHKVEEEEIERKYEIQRKAIQELDDLPLAADLIELLNRSRKK